MVQLFYLNKNIYFIKNYSSIVVIDNKNVINDFSLLHLYNFSAIYDIKGTVVTCYYLQSRFVLIL
jgi:hypothetical protein